MEVVAGAQGAGVSAIPDLSSFARALTPSGVTSRCVRKLHDRLSALDPGQDLPKRAEALEQIVRWVCDGPKPPAPGDAQPGEPFATQRLRLLVRALDVVPLFRERQAALLGSLLQESSALRLLCEIGIPNDRGLLDETTDRLAHRFLPTPPDHNDLAELAARMFRSERDASWLATIPSALVLSLHERLGGVWQPLRDAAEDALALLATRVSALGLSEDIRRRGSGGPVRQSPFFRLPHASREELPELDRACRTEVTLVQENLERFGVSVDVVYRLDVIGKCLQRIDEILVALDPRSTPDLISAETTFVAELVRARLRERSVRDVIRANTRLLARKVIERAGETGEHYITVSRGEWWKMLASAGGGGFLTVFTCVLKFSTKWGHFAPAVDGILSAANYSLSFVTMQLMGFTLATKQPSMTAAALAGSIREQRDAHQLDDLVTTIARICRSQLAAALGNIGIVIPSAVLFDLIFGAARGQPFLDAETARYTVDSFHPWVTGTVPFAALTGVLLWASSLGAGWLENWAVYRRIPEAIAQHRAKRFVGERLTRWLSRLFSKHVAGFGGSVTLGVLLGMTPAFGKFFGLPLDVRHVTLSTGALVLGVKAQGLAAFTDPALRASVGWAALGIVAIGSMNFGVSFLLALGVAFRAREVPLRRGLRLLLAVLWRFVRSPFEFVYPPKSDTGEVFSHRPSIAPSSTLVPRPDPR